MTEQYYLDTKLLLAVSSHQQSAERGVRGVNNAAQVAETQQ